MKDCRKILVVDDNETICHVLKELLLSEGYSVTTVFRGDTGLEEIRRELYHLVMLDLMLPAVSGIEILREIKKLHPKTDVIIITSHASVETAVEALRLGAQDYLDKPFEDLDIVSEVIKRVFEKRRIIEENEHLNRDLKTKTTELESAVKRLSVLNDVGQAMHSMLDIKELLNFFVNLVTSELGAQRVSLMLLNKETHILSIEASVGFDDRIAKGIRIHNGQGIAGWVTQNGEAILVEDIEQDPRFNSQSRSDAYDSNSFISAPLLLSVPIKYQRETLGVININNKQNGGVFTEHDLDFVTTLANHASIAIKNARVFKKIEETHFEAIMALAGLLEAKDAMTGKHSNRMLQFAMQVADRLGLNNHEKENLRYAAVLHDIGKIGIPERILQKPGKLTQREFEEIKKHSQMGADLVRKIKFLSSVAPVINAHHERCDGTGYPNRLSGEEIPIEARIVTVMDAFDAMTSDRPYRSSLGRERAIQELRKHTGSQFDAQVVDEFLKLLDEQEQFEDWNGRGPFDESDSDRACQKDAVKETS